MGTSAPLDVHIGLDLGSVSVNAAVVDEQGRIVYEAPYRRHFGRVYSIALELLRDLFERFGPGIRSTSFTGNHGQVLANLARLPYEFETIAQVEGCVHVMPGVKSIISMGGQETALFQLEYLGSEWELRDFNMNGPCASGTGSFIDQQAERLASSMYQEQADWNPERIEAVLKDFIALGLKADAPSQVACRCTVFTKSDMIHLQNKGESLENIIAGLHEGNSANYISTIVSSRDVETPMAFIGGMAKNQLQVNAFRAYYPDVLVPPYAASLGALGVALLAGKRGQSNGLDLARIEEAIDTQQKTFPYARALELKKTRFPEDNRITHMFSSTSTTDVFLGIDVGSTTTKYALIDTSNRIVLKRYVQTRGKPIQVTQDLLKTVLEEAGPYVRIVGAATTGSGRNVVGDFTNADVIIDEITAHARGAVEVDPRVDTIFEIGGQDSKYISVRDTHPLDFDMNKVCAAGTGSFLHELANKNRINIVAEFQDLALSSEHPIQLADRCTVFMESDLVSYAQKGASKKDLIAGLSYSIVYNYLNRVVGKRPVGNRVMFLGGPSLNKAVVAAFEGVLGKGLVTPKHREVMGAFGAALIAKDRMARAPYETRFRSLEEIIEDRLTHAERVCTVDPNCHNQCKLKIYSFSGRKSVWGGECGRYEASHSDLKKTDNYFALRSEIFHRHLAESTTLLKQGDTEPTDSGLPTVGMQQALFFFSHGVFWTHFFDRMGFNVVVSPPTDYAISRMGIESMSTETCYPIKVSHGHVKRLSDQVDYLFLPNMINMRTPRPEEGGYFCPLVEGNNFMIRAALGLDESKVLAPSVHFKYEDRRTIDDLFVQMKDKLGCTRKQVREAYYSAQEVQSRFEDALRSEGEKIRSAIEPGDLVIVVTGRPYNLYDERLNLKLGQNLSKIGMKGIPMDFCDSDVIDLSDFPDMYWGLGARVLKTARMIARKPDWFGLHLTNFSCGADSFIEHFYKYLMGSKPYLILELDEHSAVAGVRTRIEAFKNVIQNVLAGQSESGRRIVAARS
ncbi:MAG: CoA activase [Deltaproteobacteria bacterium]|nr:CoA activase [Deltaproteobacteria bacterium]